MNAEKVINNHLVPRENKIIDGLSLFILEKK
jgi:hypothetical protein